MPHKVNIALVIVAGLLSTGAIAGSPSNPGGGGRAIAGTTATARSLDGAAGIPGASSWGGARAAIGQGDITGLTNHELNTIAKDGNGGAPTPGAP